MTLKPIVSITRYAVSLLPEHDVNYKFYVLLVDRREGGWVIHNGHEYYTPEGTWDPTSWKARVFPDRMDALAVAEKLAPGITVNGRTATEAYLAYRLTQG
jgi:hypothetical protein